MPSKPLVIAGQSCTDSIGAVTCGDYQWCVQEKNVNDGVGVCASFCDPSTPGTCGAGYSCVELGIALVASAPVIHVCQVTGSDASVPGISLDGSVVVTDGGPQPDAAVPEGGPVISHPLPTHGGS
jgi:hypothetical protein